PDRLRRRSLEIYWHLVQSLDVYASIGHTHAYEDHPDPGRRAGREGEGALGAPGEDGRRACWSAGPDRAGERPSVGRPRRLRAADPGGAPAAAPERFRSVILADTSVWVDHLRQKNLRLAGLLAEAQVCCHPFVIGELALGNLRPGSEILGLLANLPQMAPAAHAEVLGFVA